MTQSTKEKSQNGEVKPTSPNSDLKLDFDSFWSYSDAPESSDHIKLKEKYDLFINGKFVAGKKGRMMNTINPATEKPLTEFTEATSEDIDFAVKSARNAYDKTWSKLTGKERGKYIYRIARMIQEHAKDLAIIESMDGGKPIRESRDVDVPLAAAYFFYYAGWADKLDYAFPGRKAEPVGVCGQIIPWNFPLLMLSWKIAPALAAGNTVVLKPAEYTSLTALLFADICREAGLPKGVVNIVTGDGTTGAALVEHPGIAKVAFTGSTEVGRKIRTATAGSGKALTLELGGKSPYIVFDDADIDSAVEGLVDAIWFNQGQVCCAGSRLLVQEGVASRFHAKLRARMDTLRVGSPLDKSIDVGAIVDPKQLEAIRKLVDGNSSGTTYRANCEMPESGCFYPPTLITGLSTADPLMQEEIFGPVLVGTTFRTPSEAVDLANNTRYGLAATLWSENINVALDIAPKLAAGVVWVNGTNMFDAAAPFGGVRESGFGREGGPEGLSAYTRPKGTAKALKPIAPHEGDGAPADPLDRTAKLYVGGKQARPDGGYSRAVHGPKGALLGYASLAN